ncbi:hypothetical protein ACIQF6_34325 [Kitasatospora sp. NPDC092948]|uniref:hypothetical protein n=1 Tax=Kitasatospora sp. NPDC092948 TaxID=3364088 RepID=UPI003800CBD0
MNALHQHLLDSSRAARHGEPAPPLPGTHDVAALRAALAHHREARREARRREADRRETRRLEARRREADRRETRHHDTRHREADHREADHREARRPAVGIRRRLRDWLGRP